MLTYEICSKMSPTRSTKAIVLCTLLCLATLLDPTDARKSNSGSSRRTGGVSGGRVTKPQGYANPGIASLSYGPGQAAQPRPQPSAPKHADPSIAQFSYGGNQPAISKASAPVQHSAPPSAPVAAPAPGARPIGWNADNNQAAVNKPQVNSAPYPAQNSAPYPQNPPPYSAVPNNGPPPAYSQYPNPNAGPPKFNEAPPAYHGQGGYPGQNPGGYPGQNPGGYPGQNPGGYPGQNSGYPGQNPGYQNNYPAPGGYPAQQYPSGGLPGGQPTIINNHYGSPGGGSSGGSGLQTALIAGVGGLALYGALKPSETKTIIINNTATIVPENATVPEGATVLPHNATLPEGVVLTPLQVATEQPVLLAAYPGMENGTTLTVPESTTTTTGDMNTTSSNDNTTEQGIAGYPSTGLYPSLPPSNISERIDLSSSSSTGVPLATYPESTPTPIALASLESSTEKPAPAKGGVPTIQVTTVLLLLPMLRCLL